MWFIWLVTNFENAAVVGCIFFYAFFYYKVFLPQSSLRFTQRAQRFFVWSKNIKKVRKAM